MESSQKCLTVALFQGHTELGKKSKNVRKMKELIVEAKEKGADVLVFPELFTTGYTLSNDLMRQLAEDKSGATFMQLSQQAKEAGIAVLYGYPELVEKGESKLYYNSAQFISKEGVSLANYHKTHLWIDDKQIEAVFTPGDSLDVFECCGVKIGLLICFDAEFSETVRVLATKGAKLILAPTACPNDFDLKPVVDLLLPAHCYENCVHMAFVNCSDSEFSGCSRFYDDQGQALLSLGAKDEGIFTAVFKGNGNTSYHLKSRRPELYRVLDRETK